jgi:hypothetical protein
MLTTQCGCSLKTITWWTATLLCPTHPPLQATIDEHFDFIQPHPDQADRFLGLDIEANARSMTVWVCDNVFADYTAEVGGSFSIQDKCRKASGNFDCPAQIYSF